MAASIHDRKLTNQLMGFPADTAKAHWSGLFCNMTSFSQVRLVAPLQQRSLKAQFAFGTRVQWPLCHACRRAEAAFDVLYLLCGEAISAMFISGTTIQRPPPNPPVHTHTHTHKDE